MQIFKELTMSTTRMKIRHQHLKFVTQTDCKIWVMGRPFKTFVRKVVRFHCGPIQAGTMVRLVSIYPVSSYFFRLDLDGHDSK